PWPSCSAATRRPRPPCATPPPPPGARPSAGSGVSGSATLAPPAAATFDLAPFARLNGPPGAPVALAVSGGGDSLALLLMAADWAARAGRRLIVLTVDHRLQPQSGRWAD